MYCNWCVHVCLKAANYCNYFYCLWLWLSVAAMFRHQHFPLSHLQYLRLQLPLSPYNRWTTIIGWLACSLLSHPDRSPRCCSFPFLQRSWKVKTFKNGWALRSKTGPESHKAKAASTVPNWSTSTTDEIVDRPFTRRWEAINMWVRKEDSWQSTTALYSTIWLFKYLTSEKKENPLNDL